MAGHLSRPYSLLSLSLTKGLRMTLSPPYIPACLCGGGSERRQGHLLEKDFLLEEGAGECSQPSGSRVWPFPRVPPQQMGPGPFVPGPLCCKVKCHRGAAGRGQVGGAGPQLTHRRAPEGLVGGMAGLQGGAVAQGLN